MYKSFDLFFLLVLKVDIHGKFWEPLIQLLGG